MVWKIKVDEIGINQRQLQKIGKWVERELIEFNELGFVLNFDSYKWFWKTQVYQTIIKDDEEETYFNLTIKIGELIIGIHYFKDKGEFNNKGTKVSVVFHFVKRNYRKLEIYKKMEE